MGFEGNIFASPASEKEEGKINNEIPKRGSFQHIAKDGTVSFHDTYKAVQEAIEEENENSD